jgi:hypothetical protein
LLQARAGDAAYLGQSHDGRWFHVDAKVFFPAIVAGMEQAHR